MLIPAVSIPGTSCLLNLPAAPQPQIKFDGKAEKLGGLLLLLPLAPWDCSALPPIAPCLKPLYQPDDCPSACLRTSTDPESIASMTTEEWRRKFEPDGRVSLWVEEEFNSGSRLVVSTCFAPALLCRILRPCCDLGLTASAGRGQGGRAVHKGGYAGRDSGEGRPSEYSTADTHTVRIYSHEQVLSCSYWERR